MLGTERLPATRPKPYRLSWIASPLKMGPTGYPETSLTKHELKLRNAPEERKPELSRLTFKNMIIFFIVNHLTPNGHFSGRTAPLTYRCCIFLFIEQIYVLNILNMLHTLRFFLFKMPFIS
jgi:hypothetical protein